MQLEAEHGFQALAAVLCSVAYLHSSRLDDVVAGVWERCKTSVLFRRDSWEPGVVSVVWTVCLGCWCAFLLYNARLSALS